MVPSPFSGWIGYPTQAPANALTIAGGCGTYSTRQVAEGTTEAPSQDCWGILEGLVESLNCTLCRMNMITKNALNGSQICQIASFAVLFCLTFHPGGLGQSPLVLVLVASGCQCRASMSIKLCFTLKTYYGTILDHPTLIDPCWLAGRVESYAIRPPVNPVFRHFSPLSRSIQAPRPIEPRA